MQIFGFKLLRSSVRNYAIGLCFCYMILVLMFHSNLDSGDRSHTRHLTLASLDNQHADYDNIFKDTAINQTQKFAVNISTKKKYSLEVMNFLERRIENHTMQNFNPHVKYKDRQMNSHFKAANPQVVECLGGDPNVKESYDFIQLSPKFYVYSVFWDQRMNDFDNKEGNAYIRIMTVISSYVAKKEKRDLFCMFQHRWINFTIPVLAHYYEMCENHGRTYGGFILSCKVPHEIYNPKLKDNNSLPLCSIKISPSRLPNDPAAKNFKVINTKPVQQKNSFAVCTSPLYGNVPEIKLIEFIELSTILGASHITFYNYDISAEMIDLMNYYSQQGKVTLLPWPLPKIFDQSQKLLWYNGQLIAILDCMYRNMAFSDFVALNDIDEYIVPYGNFTDWHEMINEIDNENIVAFQINSVFLDPKFADKTTSSNLITIKGTTKTSLSSRVRTKCLVKPDRMFEAGIHHISKPINAALKTERIDLPIAQLHHYRSCQPNFGMKCKDVEAVNIIPLRYGKILMNKVIETVDNFTNFIAQENVKSKETVKQRKQSILGEIL